MYFLLISVILPLAASAEYLPIMWNLSTDFGRSKIERLYEYPMFTEIAPSPCDLTEGVCDIGCCVDPDCDVSQKKLFNCTTVAKPCTRPFARYDCNCPFDRPFWFTALCYVHENPIYLGLFYKTQSKIEDLKLFLARMNTNDHKYEKVEAFNYAKEYKFGSTVLSFVYQNGSLTPARHAFLPEKNFPPGHSCQIPVKYLQDSKHSCYVRLTPGDCENGFALAARSYLLRNENSPLPQDVPTILKNLETEELAKVDIVVKYSSSQEIFKRITGKFHKYFLIHGDLYEIGNDINLYKTFSNGTHCSNVVAKVVFNFTTNATEILNVNILFVLTNVSTVREQPGYETYVKKEHVVSFTDIGTRGEIDIADDYAFNRGYYVGENLNFGFNRTSDSHTYWEKGYLKIFLNGGTCDRSTHIAFGYNSYAKCLLKSSLSNCIRAREEVELKLDSLIRGEILAPYGNYRTPRRSAIPLLRNYKNTHLNDFNSTGCIMPVQQDVYVEYTTVYTSKGHPVHRAVGLMINRTFANVENSISVKLITQVIFLQVEIEEKKFLSRFWQKVYSPEYSENSWLNIFNIFDHPITEEESEETFFWFFLPIVMISTTLMLTRNNR